MSDTATREIQLRDKLRVEQSQWLPMWRQCAAFCCPEKQRAVDNAYAQINEQIRPHFNPMRQSSTAIDALNVLSGGCKSWIIPGNDEGWGGMWEPDESREDSTEVKDWLAECTQRSLPHMDRSGFFTAGHEMFQDLGWAGTVGLMIDDGTEGNLMYCEAMTPTNFLVQRDSEDRVARIIIAWSRAASIIAGMFTEPGDVVPEIVKSQVLGNDPNQKHELIQSIYVRTAAQKAEKRDYEPPGQPVASCWIHVASHTVMRERGYPEMPFVAPRWNKWAGTTSSAYGTSPAMQALADMKGLNLLDMVMATRGELEINPRVKVMSGQSGNIDLSPGGVTQVNERDSVTEWAVAGNYPVGKDQNQVIENRIKRAFFTDLWEAITPVAREREINIPVMQSIQREAADRISPAIGRAKQDFFDPAMMRIFMMCYRAGVFSPPPQDAFHQDKAGRLYLVLPKVVMANRMTRTLNARKSYAFSQAWGRAQLMAQTNPEILDVFDMELITRDLARGDGMPPDWMRSETDVKKLRVGRAKAKEAALAQQTMASAISRDPVGLANLAGLGPQPG